MNKPPAFQSGMRAKEEAPKHETSKAKIRRIEIEPASNGGHIVTVHRHPPASTKNSAMLDMGGEPQKHAHTDKASAHAHVGELMDQMSPTP